jgi:PQQ-dependent catabolism-associated CXXCW motif protein
VIHAAIRSSAGAIAAGLLAAAAAYAQDSVPEPETYRSADYRAPTPATLKGARVLTTAEAEAIWRDKRGAFIDVMPHPPKPANLPAGTVWRETPRRDIPGSMWLPDTGYGKLSPQTEAYLQDGLTRVSKGQRDAPLVIYCQANCWMSWNAAKRALSYGYSSIGWYPDGTDGWQLAGLPLGDASPEPRPVEPAR